MKKSNSDKRRSKASEENRVMDVKQRKGEQKGLGSSSNECGKVCLQGGDGVRGDRKGERWGLIRFGSKAKAALQAHRREVKGEKGRRPGGEQKRRGERVGRRRVAKF